MAGAMARQCVYGGAETHFAKKLASNEKTIRDRAIKKLRVWISSRRLASSDVTEKFTGMDNNVKKSLVGLCETDLLKLWKGLFYCMWMSDKTKVQEELAETMAQLLHCFQGANEAFDFLAGFFKTMFREWHGIDRLRLDKFYLLIRKFIYESILLLKNHNWDDRTISLFNETLGKGPLTSTDKLQQVPEGVQSHVIQVYIDELFKVDSGQITSFVFLRLLEPFSHLLATSKSKVITWVLSERIFNELEKLENGENGCHVKVDFSALAEQFFALASRQDIPMRNRNILYVYLKKFRKFSENTTAGDTTGDSGASDGIQETHVNGQGKQLHNKGDEPSNDIDDEPLNDKDQVSRSSLPSSPIDIAKAKEDAVVQATDNGSDILDVNDAKLGTKEDKTRKPKKKKVRKRKCDDPREYTAIVRVDVKSSTDEVVVDIEKSAKTKRRKSAKNEIPAEKLENGQKAKSRKEGAKKGRKRKGKKVTVSSADEEIVMHGNEIVADDTEQSQQESNLLDGSYLSTLPAPNFKQKLRSFSRKDTASAEMIESRLTPGEEGDKAGSKQETDDVDCIPLAIFLRHSVKKAMVDTKPKKIEDRKRLVHDQANSTPENRRKQVRIELSKNTSHTTKDYRQSLQCSLVIPYDSKKKPVQSSLKSPLTETLSPRSTALISPKRASAADFF